RLRLEASIPGNGLCSFNVAGIHIQLQGGAQDGAAKGGSGGGLGVFKGLNLLGRRVDGSTGKSFAYGATGGLYMIQNYADSRACIRMSGADIVFGGRITVPVSRCRTGIASRAHLKGFAFEYMTGGRVVVLGDPGPWICSGMTGGVVYQCLYPELGFDRSALDQRLASGAEVVISGINAQGISVVRSLLATYIQGLRSTLQHEEADEVRKIREQVDTRFVMILPRAIVLEQE
ncbi:MAG: glutamate synthase, partial [Desulfovibrionales bacterium]